MDFLASGYGCVSRGLQGTTELRVSNELKTILPWKMPLPKPIWFWNVFKELLAPFTKSMAITADSPLPESTETSESAGLYFSQSTISQNTISVLLYVLEIFSMGMMPRVITNKTDVFPLTLVRMFHIKQFSNCTRNVIYMPNYPYRWIDIGKTALREMMSENWSIRSTSNQ